MVVSANAPTLSKLLCLGSNGPEVQSLQQLLGAQSGAGPKPKPDGRFGKGTLRALAQWQRKNGLRPDGVVGPKTAEKLGWRYNAPAPKPYTIRMDRPPMPGNTPPQVAIAEVIRGGYDRYRTMIVQEVAKCAVSDKGRINATRDIETMFYPSLMINLDNFLLSGASKSGAHSFDQTMLTFDATLLKRGFVSFNYLLLRLGENMKEAGWIIKPYVQLIVRTEPLEGICDEALKLTRGEQSGEITAAKIRMMFQNALGAY